MSIVIPIILGLGIFLAAMSFVIFIVVPLAIVFSGRYFRWLDRLESRGR